MSKNVDISRGIYKYVPQLLFEYFQKDKDMKVTLSKKKSLFPNFGRCQKQTQNISVIIPITYYYYRNKI